jgi:hypothetical protein
VTWVTWKQHRLEGAWSLALGTALVAAIGFVAYELHAAGCPREASSYCFTGDVAGQLAQRLVQFNLYQYGLVVLPALAGAFIGCPLVAREVEQGTHRLAWTQGVTRLRWLLTKLVLVFVPVLIGAAVAGWLEIVLIDQLGTDPNHWAYFDQQAPLTVAATLFALSLGVATGAVMGRSIPAMAVTLIAFVAVRLGLAEVGRPNYMAPLAYTTQTMSFPPPGSPSAWWIDQPSFYDAAGHVISNGGGPLPTAAAYAIQHYQPGDRFWTFQSIESAILTVLAVILIGFTIYWVTRRVS